MAKKKNVPAATGKDTPAPPRQITMRSLAGIDLNLLVAFDALMQERNVSRAADRIGLSQSAMSHALQRLRYLIDDPLFVRGVGGMIPTPRAQSVYSVIEPALIGIRVGLSGEMSFMPQTSRRRFTLAMSDLISIVQLPQLTRTIRQQAPSVEIVIKSAGSTDGIAAVATGQADFGISVFRQKSPLLIQQSLSKLPHVVVADLNNPVIASGRITLDDYLAASHVAISVGDDDTNSVDVALATEGLNRHIVLQVPYFAGLPHIVIGTDLLATVPAVILPFLTRSKHLKTCPLPFGFADVYTSVVWQASREYDPGHRWLRTLIIDTLHTDQ